MTQILEQPEVIHPKTRPRVHPGELANDAVRRFVHRAIRLCRPDRIYWCNGSDYERERLTEQAVREGAFEQCKPDPSAATPGAEAPGAGIESLFKDCMRGRTMYVVPFMTGPVGGPPGKLGVEITDSLCVTLKIAETMRIGDVALRAMGPNDSSFARGLHSVGVGDGVPDCPLPPDDVT